MYVKLDENNIPTEWPVSAQRIRFDNKSVSFPSDMNKADVRKHGYAKFQLSDPETYDSQWQEAREILPVEVDGIFIQSWEIVELYTPEEKLAKIAEQEASQLQNLVDSTRAKRDTLLSSSDWTQVADAPVDQVAWKTYRQALRDIPTQTGFPHGVQWPIKPE